MGKGRSNRNWRGANGNHRGGNNPDGPQDRDRRRNSPPPSSRSGSSRRKDDVWIPPSPRGDDHKDSESQRGRPRVRTPSEDSKVSGGGVGAGAGGRYRSRSPINHASKDDHSRSGRPDFNDDGKRSRPAPHKKRHRSPKRRRSPSPGFHGGSKSFKKTKRGRSPHFGGDSRDRRRSGSPLPRRGDSRSKDNNSPARHASPEPRPVARDDPASPKATATTTHDRAHSPSSSRQRSKSPTDSRSGNRNFQKSRYRSPHRRGSSPPRKFGQYSRTKKDKRNAKRRKPSPGRRRPTPTRSERSLSPRRRRTPSPSSPVRRRSPSANHDTTRNSRSPARDTHQDGSTSAPGPSGSPRSPLEGTSSKKEVTDNNKDNNNPERKRDTSRERGESPRRSDRGRSASPEREFRRGGKTSNYDHRRDGKGRERSPLGGSRRRGSFKKDRDVDHSYPQYPTGPKFNKKGKNRKKSSHFDRRDGHGRRSPPSRPPFTGPNAIPRGPANKSKAEPSFRSKRGSGYDNEEARRRSKSFEDVPKRDTNSRDGDGHDDPDRGVNDHSQMSPSDHGRHQSPQRRQSQDGDFNAMPPPPRPNRNDGHAKGGFKGPRYSESALEAPPKPVGGDDTKGGRIRFSLNKSGNRKTPASRSEQADGSARRIPTGPAAMQIPTGPAAQRRGGHHARNQEIQQQHQPPPPSPPQPPTPMKQRRPPRQLGRYNGGGSELDRQKRQCYERVTMVGEGTYGRVYKAINKGTKQFVALKRIRLEHERDGFPITAMREMRLLQTLEHRNIVCLLETMVEFNEFYMVFEYMDHDLTGILNHPTFVLEECHIKHLAQQFFEGLGYLHHRGVLHRDIKGSNILLNNDGELKIADFGLARHYNKKKKGLEYTNRIITLWYRGPEILLGATTYNDKVDMWSAGCLFAELFTKSAIFPGKDEIDQLEKIYDVMGTPTLQMWPALGEMPWYSLIRPSEPFKPCRFKESFKDKKEVLPGRAYDLARSLLSYDPDKRPSCAEVLKHPYFSSDPKPEPPLHIRDLQGEWHEYESKNRRKQEAKEREREKREQERILYEKQQQLQRAELQQAQLPQMQMLQQEAHPQPPSEQPVILNQAS